MNAIPWTAMTDEQWRLVVDNRGLAIHIARQFGNRIGLSVGEIRMMAEDAGLDGLYRAAREYVKELGPFKFYASVALRRAFRGWLTLRKNQRAREVSQAVMDRVHDRGQCIVDATDFAEWLLSRLTGRERLLLKLRVMCEWPERQVAEAAGLSCNGARTATRRALAFARECAGVSAGRG